MEYCKHRNNLATNIEWGGGGGGGGKIDDGY